MEKISVKKILTVALQGTILLVATVVQHITYSDPNVQLIVATITIVIQLSLITWFCSLFSTGLSRLKPVTQVIVYLCFINWLVSMIIRFESSHIMLEAIFVVVIFLWYVTVKILATTRSDNTELEYKPNTKRKLALISIAVFCVFIGNVGHLYNWSLAMAMNELFGDFFPYPAFLWFGFAAFTLSGLSRDFGKRGKIIWVSYALVLLVILIAAYYRLYNKSLFHDFGFNPMHGRFAQH